MAYPAAAPGPGMPPYPVSPMFGAPAYPVSGPYPMAHSPSEAPYPVAAAPMGPPYGAPPPQPASGMFGLDCMDLKLVKKVCYQMIVK
jgi:hypothetical protein